MKLISRNIFIVVLMLLSSCANKVAPEGGAIDKEPPVLIAAYPENQSVNFIDNEIELEFDEFIELDNPAQNIFISPPLHPKPQYKVSKKNLTIKLPDSLKQNITYTVNFGNALVDIHEKNILKDFKYIFSTSSTLDSLKISGTIKRADDLSPEKECIAVLYDHELTDSLCFKLLPEYYSRVDEEGKFSIDNIKQGNYILAAISDANSNFMAEFASERIAYNTEVVEIPSTTKFELYTFQQSALEVKPISAKKLTGGEILISFNGNAAEYEFAIIKDTLLYSEWNSNRDSVTLYHNNKSDSVAVITRSELFTDTLWSYRKARTDNAADRFVMVTGLGRLGNDSLQLTFNKPIMFTPQSKMMINGDTSQLTSLWKSTSSFFTQLAIPVPDSSAVLIIDAGSLNSYEGVVNDTLIINLPVLKERESGSLELNISPFSTGQTYVELKTESGKIFDQVSVGDGGLFEILRVIPGEYTLTAFCDLNNNGKWDGGDFFIKKQPEPVKNYSQKITVRANWTIQIDWIIEN